MVIAVGSLLLAAIIGTTVLAFWHINRALPDAKRQFSIIEQLLQPSMLAKNSAVPTYAGCYESEFEKVCKSGLTFSLNQSDIQDNLPASITDAQIRSYVNGLTSSFEAKGWSFYKMDDSTSMYRISDKKFGSTTCEVLINYAAVDPVSKKSPSYYEDSFCLRSYAWF